jgi:hypothetical protein
MQRGARKYDRKPKDNTPDYANFSPIMSKGESLHFGVEGAQRDRFLNGLKEEVLGLFASGYNKPVEICRDLNRKRKRTFLGEMWSPRLCHFLKKELRSLDEREKTERSKNSNRVRILEPTIRPVHSKGLPGRPPRKPPPSATAGVPVEQTNSKQLTNEEMKRRIEALKAFYSEGSQA